MPQLQMSPPWLAGITSDRDAEYIDAVQPGLVLRIRRGRMVWFVRYLFDGSARRYRIGEHPAVGLSAARKLASVVRGRVAAGDDPQAEKRAKREAVRRRRMGETVSGALASWLKDEKQGPIGRWKGGLEGGSARAALSHIRRLDRMLGKKLLSEVTPREIERVVLACEAPATRNRALCAFRGFLAWAIRNGLIAKDPTTGMPKEHETARTRVLSDDEIRTLINGFDQTRYGRALRFLFLTALRRDEVLGLQWSWIDMEKGVLTIPPEAEKAGRIRDELRRAGLPPQAVALLGEQRSFLFAEGVRSEYVFATSTGERPLDTFKPVLYRLRGRRSNGLPPSKDKRAKQRVAVLSDDVTIHDIRRTVADALLNRIGAPPWIVDHVVLGHARPKLLRTYMPTLPLGEARDALQRWGDELDRILRADGGIKGTNEVPGLDAGTPATRNQPTLSVC
jgi:integrase